MALAQTQCLLRTEVKAQVCVCLFVRMCVCACVCVSPQGDLNLRTYQTKSFSTMSHHK